MNSKNYFVSRNKNKKETVYFEYDKMKGYSVRPKVHHDDEIEVSKIIFVNSELSEKIIRKKIDKRIEYLLNQLKLIDEESGTSEGTIKRTLMDAEKLRVQIISNYVKYLGHTYGSLTMSKIQLIIDELRYKLYILKENEQIEKIENRRGR